MTGKRKNGRWASNFFSCSQLLLLSSSTHTISCASCCVFSKAFNLEHFHLNHSYPLYFGSTDHSFSSKMKCGNCPSEEKVYGVAAETNFFESLQIPPFDVQISPPLPQGDSSPVSLGDIGRSRIRRHGSRLISVLRSLTNSGATDAEPTPMPTPQSTPSNVQLYSRKIHSLPFLRGLNPETTVVHRSPQKSRPNLPPLDTAVASPEVSSSTSGEANSSKSSSANRNESTGLTSFNSKFSLSMSSKTHNSSENKKVSKSPQTEGQSSQEKSLPPIHETPSQEALESPSQPVPTIVTVERAAAAKIHLECHYNDLLTKQYSPRSLRRRELEVKLYNDTAKTPAEKDDRRRAWLRLESNHLRESRIMKARGCRVLKGRKGTDPVTSNYESIKILGKGSFGVVRLVREKRDADGHEETKKQVYAMKVIRKSDMLRNSQEGHLRAERDFLVSAEGSRWVVPLIASFQDTNNLYLVMDYMPGGDFLGLLIRDNILSESTTKWYIAEMILCIEEAHALRWIHRDIKPDNFLISSSGHLKISDFGLAFDGHWSHDQSYFNNHRYSILGKLGITVEGDTIDRKDARAAVTALKVAQVLNDGREKHQKKSDEGDQGEGILNWRNRNGNRTLARSVVGTSQYMAPEVIRGERYDARCDWWSVAIILYECLYGHTPFLAEEGGRQQTKMNILDHRKTFAFPHKPTVSTRCKDLIQRVLQEKQDRLCSGRYKNIAGTRFLAPAHRNQDYAGRYVYPHDAEDIKAHKWFKDIPWEHLHRMPPPFIPEVQSLEDTRYFDEEEPISEVLSSSHEIEYGEEEKEKALRMFNREIQILAKGFVANTYDTVRLKKIDREIDGFNMGDQEKEYLRGFVKHYGKREKKRPRDRMLRDKEIQGKVLELRKKGAFLGYTWRRMRRDSSFRGSVASAGGVPASVVIPRKKSSMVWMRGRLSLH